MDQGDLPDLNLRPTALQSSFLSLTTSILVPPLLFLSLIQKSSKSSLTDSSSLPGEDRDFPGLCAQQTPRVTGPRSFLKSLCSVVVRKAAATPHGGTALSLPRKRLAPARLPTGSLLSSRRTTKKNPTLSSSCSTKTGPKDHALRAETNPPAPWRVHRHRTSFGSLWSGLDVK